MSISPQEIDTLQRDAVRRGPWSMKDLADSLMRALVGAGRSKISLVVIQKILEPSGKLPTSDDPGEEEIKI